VVGRLTLQTWSFRDPVHSNFGQNMMFWITGRQYLVIVKMQVGS
jgi:hypothetical protein